MYSRERELQEQAGEDMHKEATTEYCQLPGKYGYKWPTLSELHIKLFGEDFEGGHDALEDVKACAKCLFELQNRQLIT